MKQAYSQLSMQPREMSLNCLLRPSTAAIVHNLAKMHVHQTNQDDISQCIFYCVVHDTMNYEVQLNEVTQLCKVAAWVPLPAPVTSARCPSNRISMTCSEGEKR